MPDTLELRSASRAERRNRLFERLDDADPVETAVLLDRYRIERGTRLDWESETGDGTTREVRITKEAAFDADETPEFDVRDLPPQRHPKIFDAFEALERGESLTLVNDHEPTPLYHQMVAEMPSFDAEGYAVDHVGPKEFVATLPTE